MKYLKFILIAFAAACSAVSLNADVPRLAAGVYINDSLNNLDIGYGATPSVVDWNNDGNKDLVVGDLNSSKGYISLYLNQGTDESPLFDGSSFIQENGTNLTTFSGG